MFTNSDFSNHEDSSPWVQAWLCWGNYKKSHKTKHEEIVCLSWIGKSQPSTFLSTQPESWLIAAWHFISFQINFKLIFFCPPIKDTGFLLSQSSYFSHQEVGLDSDLKKLLSLMTQKNRELDSGRWNTGEKKAAAAIVLQWWQPHMTIFHSGSSHNYFKTLREKSLWCLSVEIKMKRSQERNWRGNTSFMSQLWTVDTQTCFPLIRYNWSHSYHVLWLGLRLPFDFLFSLN